MSRIIAGRAGGLALRSVPGDATRPTTDRTKEALFSWLTTRGWLDSTAVADLYAGSGALGLEALSRGAESVVLIERDRKAAAVCTANARAVAYSLNVAVPQVITRPVDHALDRLLGITGTTDGTHPADAAQAVPALDGLWDLILADPPYPLDGLELAGSLQRMAQALLPGGLLVLERSSRSTEPIWPETLELVEQRDYGETRLYFVQRED